MQRLLDAEAKSCESEAKASLADLQKEKAIQVWKFTAIFCYKQLYVTRSFTCGFINVESPNVPCNVVDPELDPESLDLYILGPPGSRSIQGGSDKSGPISMLHRRVKN